MAYFGARFWGYRYWGRRFWGQAQHAVALILSWLSHPKLVLTRVPVDNYLYLDNPHVIKWKAQEYNSSDVLEAGDSYTFTGRISATDSGVAIGSCTASMAELGGLPGTYSGSIAASTLTTDLTAYIGERVFEIVQESNGNGVKSKELIVAERSFELEGS